MTFASTSPRRIKINWCSIFKYIKPCYNIEKRSLPKEDNING